MLVAANKIRKMLSLSRYYSAHFCRKRSVDDSIACCVLLFCVPVQNFSNYTGYAFWAVLLNNFWLAF